MNYIILVVLVLILWIYYLVAERPDDKDTELQQLIDSRIKEIMETRKEVKSTVNFAVNSIVNSESKNEVKSEVTSENKSEKVIEGLDDISGRYCKTCDDLSFGKCIQCFNCAFKAQGYKGKCMSGESIPDKPLESTERWLVNDTFWRNVYATPRTSCAVAPFDK